MPTEFTEPYHLRRTVSARIELEKSERTTVKIMRAILRGRTSEQVLGHSVSCHHRRLGATVVDATNLPLARTVSDPEKLQLPLRANRSEARVKTGRPEPPGRQSLQTRNSLRPLLS